MASKRFDLFSIVRIGKSHMRQRMYKMARILEAEWKRMAATKLKTTSVTYRNNINVEVVDESRLSLVLRGTLPNMLEQGMGPGGVGTYGPYDVRKFLLKSGTSNLRYWKGKPYLNVPFRISTKQLSALGYNIRGINALSAAKTLAHTETLVLAVHNIQGQVVGRRYVTRFPKGVLNPGDPLSGKARQALEDRIGGPPGRLGSGFGPRLNTQAQFRRDPSGAGFMVQEPHAVDPMSGLVRFGKVYGASSGTQSKYGTWRRATSWGKPWVSKGIYPRKFAEKLDKDAAIRLAFSDIV